MAKKIDISDKLNFDENPVIVVEGVELEVNSDAETMLRIMGAFEDKDEIKAINKAVTLLFGDEGREKLYSIRREGRKLSLGDFSTIVSNAVDAVMGTAGGEKG